MNPIKNSLVLLTLTFCLLPYLAVQAQRNRSGNQPTSSKSTTAPKDTGRLAPRLVLLARNYGDSVVLRWSPNRAAHFLAGSQTGYWVQRIELTAQNRKGKVTLLNPTPVKPWTLDEARRRLKPTDQFPAIALQMLYGKGYTKTFTPNATSIINLSEEQNNRFGIALMAADFSAKAADAVGLRWVDRQPRQADALYLYRVYSANPKPTANDLRDTASVVVIPPDRFKPAAPLIEDVKNGDGVITLTWNRRSTQGAFSAFYIERSTDGKQFSRLNQSPYIQSKPDAATQKRDTTRFRSDRKGQSFMTYTDSVKVNYRTFFYRVVGIDAFGDLSPASDIVTGMGHDLTPPLAPTNLRTQVIDNRQVRIQWTKGTLRTPDAAGYVVGRSRDVNGPFASVTTATLPINTLEFIDSKPALYSNYYTVGAVDTSGNVSFAPAVAAIIADVVAPLPPFGLKAIADSNGVVHLSWPLGQDDDIVAYKVYRSYERDNDFYRQLTPTGRAMTSYTDTLPSPMLNEVVFYKIVAIDRTGNHSAFSQALDVNVPDKIPPVVPVLKNVVVAATGVTLEAVPSSSPDVVEHRLYRKEGEGTWLLLRRLPGQNSKGMTVRDTTVQSGHTYSYAMTAVDDARLESARSFAIPVQFVAHTATPVRNVQARYDANRKAVLVSWSFPTTSEPFHFVIYRSRNGEGLTLFKIVDRQQRLFQDTDATPSGRYTYAVRVHYHERGASVLSEIAQVSN